MAGRDAVAAEEGVDPAPTVGGAGRVSTAAATMTIVGASPAPAARVAAVRAGKDGADPSAAGSSAGRVD